MILMNSGSVASEKSPRQVKDYIDALFFDPSLDADYLLENCRHAALRGCM